MTVASYSEQLWTNTLRCGSIYNEKFLKGLSVEGIHLLICQAFCHWGLEHQHTSLGEFSQKVESLTDLKENEQRTDKPEIVNKKERWTTYKTNINRPSRGHHVISVERSPQRSSRCGCAAPSSANPIASKTTTVLISDLVGAFELGKLDWDGTTSMESTPFCGVFLNDNHKTARCQQVKNTTYFNRTRDRNFSYWRNRQVRRNEQLLLTNNYRQYRRNGWQNCCRSRLPNRSETHQLAPAIKMPTTTTALLCGWVPPHRTRLV